MALVIGQDAPRFALETPDGERTSLDDFLKRDRTVLLVFLRHLGCLPCREHAAKLCQEQETLQKLGVRVLVISFGTAELGRKWLEEICPTFRLLLDEERIVYRAYGLERSLIRSWSPKIFLEYFRLMRQGRKWRGIQGDSAQLGGDFVVDRRGRLALVHPSRDPADRPAVEDLLELFQSLSGKK